MHRGPNIHTYILHKNKHTHLNKILLNALKPNKNIFIVDFFNSCLLLRGIFRRIKNQHYIYLNLRTIVYIFSQNVFLRVCLCFPLIVIYFSSLFISIAEIVLVCV